MLPRTKITFPQTFDIWPVIDTWAQANGYNVRETTNTGRLYQKGIGFWVAPMMLSVNQLNGQVR
jgi:hypothetical protein